MHLRVQIDHGEGLIVCVVVVEQRRVEPGPAVGKLRFGADFVGVQHFFIVAEGISRVQIGGREYRPVAAFDTAVPGGKQQHIVADSPVQLGPRRVVAVIDVVQPAQIRRLQAALGKTAQGIAGGGATEEFRQRFGRSEYTGQGAAGAAIDQGAAVIEVLVVFGPAIT